MAITPLGTTSKARLKCQTPVPFRKRKLLEVIRNYKTTETIQLVRWRSFSLSISMISRKCRWYVVIKKENYELSSTIKLRNSLQWTILLTNVSTQEVTKIYGKKKTEWLKYIKRVSISIQPLVLKFVIKIHWFISLRIIESLQNNFLSIVFLLKKNIKNPRKKANIK